MECQKNQQGNDEEKRRGNRLELTAVQKTNPCQSQNQTQNLKPKDYTEIKKNQKLCIVGCSDSKGLAPFKEPGWDYWGVNNLYLTMPDHPWVAWFEIHDIAKTPDDKNFLRRAKPEFRGQHVNDYLAGISKLPCPVIMQHVWPEIQNSIPYPLEEILKKFGNYFTNTISYEIALGILLQYKTIAIYGVDMAVDTEYFWQRPSCEYFLGLAVGMGIEIIIPDEADLLKTRFLYGFNEPKESAWMAKQKSQIDSLKHRQDHAVQQMELAKKQVEQYTGAIAALQESMKIWKSV